MQNIRGYALKGLVFNQNLTLSRCISSSQLRGYLSILNLNEAATPKEVKESFLKLSKVYHPDNRLTGSHEKFVQLREAYDALKDGGPIAGRGYTSNRQPEYSYDQTYRAYREAHDRFYQDRRAYYDSDPFKRYPNNNYAYERTPWAERNQKADHFAKSGGPFGQTLTSFTLFSGAFAWVVIFACFITALDYRSKVNTTMRDLEEYDFTNVKDHQDYIRRVHLLRDRISREGQSSVRPGNIPSKETETILDPKP